LPQKHSHSIQFHMHSRNGGTEAANINRLCRSGYNILVLWKERFT